VASIIGQHDAIKSSEIFKSIYSPFILFYLFILASWLWSPLQSVGKGIPYARNSLENRPIPPRKLPPAIHIVSPQQTASYRPFATPPTDIGSAIVRAHVSLWAVAESGERARTYPRRADLVEPPGNILSPELTNNNNLL
jgi:hypothetical protein